MVSDNHVEVSHVWHHYGNAPDAGWVLKDIDMQIKPGELVGLLGPSGCGKTTLLRLIAGFERPIQGTISIDGRTVANASQYIPPERRGVGMVFQDFALFPHLNAWDNACFGLKARKDQHRVEWLLKLLGLAELSSRYPHELSGGQKQRLALARALAPGTSLVLLDEPFSSLDVAVRLRLRSELSSVLQTCNASGVIVTHDPQEAIAICDRVAVMADGDIHQYGTPFDLLEKPTTPFVSKFVLQSNLLPIWKDGDNYLTPLGPVTVPYNQCSSETTREVMVNDSAIKIEKDPSGKGEIQSREFHGQHWMLMVRYGEHTFRIKHPLEHKVEAGDSCRVMLKLNQKGIFYPGAIQGPLN